MMKTMEQKIGGMVRDDETDFSNKIKIFKTRRAQTVKVPILVKATKATNNISATNSE